MHVLNYKLYLRRSVQRPYLHVWHELFEVLATLLLGLSATLALECPAPPPPTPPPPLLGCENEEVPVYTPANAGDQNNPREVPSGTSENRYGCPFKVTNMSASDDEIFLKVHQCRASPCQCGAIALVLAHYAAVSAPCWQINRTKPGMIFKAVYA